MDLVRSLINSLNQDCGVVRRIAEAVTLHNIRQDQLQERKDREEQEALEKLKKETREVEAASKKDKVKDKVESPPQRSPPRMPSLFLVLSPQSIVSLITTREQDTEKILQRIQQLEEKNYWAKQDRDQSRAKVRE